MAIALASLILTASGCSSAQLDKGIKDLFKPKTSSRELFVALEATDPDIRREAIASIATSDMAAQDWAIKAFSTIARTDTDPLVRCAAIRGIEHSGRPDAAAPLLMILNWQKYREKVPSIPDDQVRWDATAVLASMCEWSLIPDDLQVETRDAFLARLQRDPSRNVRLEAARGLGFFPRDKQALESLVAATGDSDFGVVYQAERSLIRLTGETFQCDPDAWLKWLGSSADPFAKAGEVPDSMKEENLNWFQRRNQSIRRALIAWQGESKTQN